MYKVESDGRRIDSIRDPPGQRSVYIPPGDPERETYRLSTFHHYPRNSPIDPRQFAAHGFFYTGYRDRVKCFSCGQPSDNWLPGDDIALPTWHKDDCQLMNGTDTSNVPIGGSLFARNAQTAQNAISTTTYHAPNSSRTSGNTCRVENTSMFHPRVATNQLQNSTPPSVASRPVVSRASVQTRQPRRTSPLYDTFPCLHPVNPHMRSSEARLQTFLDNSSIWPAHRIRATPQQIVDAGMYYLGERDRVKCWYCNGGLQNWERDDDPMEEHAKWFPLCEFVLQQKGPDYVHQIVLRTPGLRRPNLSNPSSGSAAQGVTIAMRSNSNHSRRPVRPSSSTPQIVDPQAELRRINEQTQAELLNSPLVAEAKTMGFAENLIRAALKKQFRDHNQPFNSLESLVDAVLSVDEPAAPESNEENSLDGAAITPQSPGQELRMLEESRKCKRCHREDACVVFIPCGHLACCVSCSEQCERCPVCQEVIREKVRSYLS